MVKKGKSGRPKGSKSIGIPSISVSVAIDLARRLFEVIRDASTSRSDIADALNLKKGSISPTLGVLSGYGLIEKTSNGWKLSELGIRSINNDISAVKESFEMNSIFKDLYNRFGNEKVTSGVIIDYLRKNYRKGSNVLVITERFLDTINYIESLKRSYQEVGLSEEVKSEEEITGIAKWFKVFQLKYALTTPKEDIKKLAENINNDFKNDEDEAIKTIAESIMENKNKEEVLKILVNNLIKIASKKYPNTILYFEVSDEASKENK